MRAKIPIRCATSHDSSMVGNPSLIVSRTSLISKVNKVWIADLQDNEIGPNMKWHKVVDNFDASYGM